MLEQTELNPLHEKYGTAKKWYEENELDRVALETEWIASAQLTLPYLFPARGTKDSTILPTPYNSIGPSAVNTLASKLLLALLPPTGVFFRLLPDKKLLRDIPPDGLKQLDSELSQVENDVVEYINIKSLRVPIYEALKLLIVTGNAMVYKVPDGGIKVFNPYQYCVQRDYVGNLLTACIKETMSYTSLPTKVQEQIRHTISMDTPNFNSNTKQVEVFTMIVKENPNTFRVFQEINNIIIDNTEKTYTKDKLPYIILRWTTANNENYGRGLVSQYLGDLRSLEGLTQTIVEGSGVAAMTIFGVRPGATVKIEDLNNASNGDFVSGDLEKEISTLQVNKTGDLQVPLKLMEQIETRLAKAFLILGSQIRDSERTSATEVRAVAAELEATLGGVFSVLASEFQNPLLYLILNEMNPAVLKVTTPSITTGISAISRERDYNNLNTMLQSIAQLGPEVINTYLNIPAYLGQIATSLGMDPTSIVKSQEQIQAEQQQAMMLQQQQLAAQTGAQMVVDANKTGQLQAALQEQQGVY